MDEITTTIDAAGRLVIPAAVRRELALAPGAELVVEVHGGSIHLRPVAAAAVAKHGRLLVVRGPLSGPVPEARDIHEERLARVVEP